MVGYVVGQVIHLPALAGHRTSKLIGGTQNSSIRCTKSAPNSTRFAAFAAADLTSGTSPSRLGSSAGHQNLAPKPARPQQLDHKLGQQHSPPNSPINTTNSTHRASGSNSSIKEGSNPIKARQGPINISSSTATAAAAATMTRHPPSVENSLSEEEVHKLFA
eukprot:GHRR01022339.1.p1 GENE.GHRR01022339.1~~GHRR01022339.1.p1  ORF type:complete len:162 (+),score=43.99 GHRR01022339.1:773-1258(+)